MQHRTYGSDVWLNGWMSVWVRTFLSDAFDSVRVCVHMSREAAQECSQGRKPWVGMGNMSDKKGRQSYSLPCSSALSATQVTEKSDRRTCGSDIPIRHL